MKNRFRAIKKLVVVVLLGFCFTANATTYYFSADGDDANNGTSSVTPWKTLNKLNSIFSSLKAGDHVLFNRGDVFYGNITAQKSGTLSLPITIGAYGTGAKPIITGLTTVSAWTNLGSNIWESTSAVSALNYTNMVVVNGVNTPMGRYPNTGYLIWDSRSGNTSITSSSLNSAVTNWTGAEVAFFTTTYRISRDKITAQSGGTLTYTTPSVPDLFQAASTYFIQNFLIQNDPRTLDAQNEWYYNPSTKKLRIYSTASPTNVQIASVDTLALVSGYDYVAFDNISFQGSNSSMIELRNSQYVAITNCDFNFSGINGITSPYDNGSQNLDIENCTFNHINNNGIDIGKSVNVTIKQNTVTNIGMIPGMKGTGAGMTGSGTAEGIIATSTNSLISYNTVDSTCYTAIYFNGSNTTVDHNYVKDFCIGEGIKDGGGIYTWNDGTIQSGMKVSNNTVLNSGIVSNGIYIDSRSNGIIVSGNSVSNCQRGIYLSNSWNINVLNNTTYANTQAELMMSQTDNTITMNNLVVKNNIFLARKNNEFAGWFATISAPYITKPFTSDSNYFARPVSDSLSMQTNFNGVYTWQTLDDFKSVNGTDAHSNKSPKTITDTNDLKFVYNETGLTKTFSLPFNYIDVKNVSYNGGITLAPYSSAALIKNGAASNQSPTANAGTDQSITLPTSTVSLSGIGTDPDGTISAYKWIEISGPTSATITNANAASTSVTGLVQGVYQFQLQVTDNKGAIGLDATQVTVNAQSVTNVPPSANAGADQSITLPTVIVSLSGSGTDPDGTISAYNWTQISGPSIGIITNPTSAATTVTGLIVGVYSFQLRVTDNNGATDMDIVQVTVNPVSVLLPAVNPANTVNGLDYSYYEESGFDVVPDFTTLIPVKTGTSTGFDISLANRTQYFAFNFTGFIDVPADGQYTFYSNSDDGSTLYIDNVLVVSDDGLHGPIEISGTIGLMAGKHAISVGYFNETGTGVLTVSYAGPGFSKQVVPASSLFRIDSTSLLPAVDPANTVNGLDYAYYEASSYSAVPDFTTLTPVKTGTSAGFDISLSNRTQYFSFNFTGFIDVPSDGQYTFYTNSDDGSILYIDNVPVVNNDGLHGTLENSGTIGLMAGKHAISVGYFNQTGTGVLTVSYAGPGISKQVVPASSLYRIDTGSLLPAVNPANTVNGLDYTYYEASSYSAVPDFTTLTPVKTGTSTDFDISLSNRAQYFSFNFTGFIDVPSDGQYTFYTNSDDGSTLYIDNVLVVNNDGLHGPMETSGTIGLMAGKHAISVGYFNQTGNGVLTVSYAGPGISKQVVPASSLYRIDTGSLLPAVNPANTVNGLDYTYYEASSYSVVPDFTTLTPVKTGTTPNFDISLSNRAQYFSFDFTGFIDVPSDGQYTFYTNSDDGSMLYIDNVLVVNNDGLHGPFDTSGTIGLMAGKHAIEVGYFNQTGAGVLTVNYAGPGFSRQAVPVSSLYRISTSNLLPAVNPANTVNGLDYAYYEADSYSVVPDFSTLTPVKTGTTPNFDVSLSNRNQYFSFNFTGFIDVPSDGQYTFYSNSDDGSTLYIDSVLVVNNDGLHGPLEDSGTVGLMAGKHAISVGYFDQTGTNNVLIVSYAGPGFAKQLVPASALYRISTAGNLLAFNNNNINQAITSFAQVGIKTYPNPFGNYIEINITGVAGGYKLMLIDASGKVVWTKSGITNTGTFQQSVNTSALERGIYYLKAIQNNINSVTKLVK